jgi:hypothetical protein
MGITVLSLSIATLAVVIIAIKEVGKRMSFICSLKRTLDAICRWLIDSSK